MSCTTEELKKILIDYKEQNIIKRVGYYENNIVLSKFLKPWCIMIGEKHIIPSPWFNIESNIVNSTFINWCGTIMNKIFECPGYTVTALASNLDYITPRSVQEICMFLEKCKCVTLKTIQIPELDLFSDIDALVELCCFNEYEDPEYIVVFPVSDCLMKYAYIKQYI